MNETEWKVTCSNRHWFYERFRDVPLDDVEFAACPKCDAPRRGKLLPPIAAPDQEDAT